MRTDLDHLPASSRTELRMIADLILGRFEEAHARRMTTWRKKGRIHKIILHGSDIRGDPAYELGGLETGETGHALIVVVNHKRVVECFDFWEGLRRTFQEMFGARQTTRPVDITVLARQELEGAILKSRDLFVDVARDGIALYQDDDRPLPRPRRQSPAAVSAMARQHFDARFAGAAEFHDAFAFNLARSRTETAAFQLHQAVEQWYHTVLLVRTLSTRHVHDIRHLRNEAARIDRCFDDVWPDDAPWQTAAFDRLREAYVKARYSTHRITGDQLRWLGDRAQVLADLVGVTCRRHLEELDRRVAERGGAYAETEAALGREPVRLRI